MTRAPRLLALAVVPLVLVACGGSGDPLRDDVAALTEAANARDADRVRLLAEDLVATVQEQAAAGELDADRSERIVALARSVRTSADVIDADLLEQRRLEAENEAERKRLEEERKRLEEERKAAEEAAEREAEERGKGKGEGKGDDDGKDDDEGKGKDDD